MTTNSAVADEDRTGATDAPARLSIAKDDAFHLLQAARRRAVLRYLLEHDDREQFTMRELAEEVGAWEDDTTVRELTSTPRSRVYIALYQNHLPKLADHGVIEYDRNRGLVEPLPLLYAFEPYLGESLHAADDGLAAPVDDRPDRILPAAVGTILGR